MGSTQSQVLATCIPIEPAAGPDESAVYGNSNRIPLNGGKPITHFFSCPEAQTVAEVLQATVTKYPNYPAVGEREKCADKKLGEYKWITYSEFLELIFKMSRALKSYGIGHGDRVGIYSHSCINWQLMAYAAYFVGATVVPIYDSLGADAAKYITEHAEVKLLYAAEAKVADAQAIVDEIAVKQFIVGTDISSSKYHTMAEALEHGNEITDFAPYNPSREDIAMIMYTSGSTGMPKGCVLTHKAILTGAVGLGATGTSVDTNEVYFGFLPLAHIYEYGVEQIVIAQGGRIGYYSGDTKNLVGDIQVLKPTVITAVPRVFNRIYESMTAQIENQGPVTRALLKWAIKFTSDELMADQPPSLLIDMLLFKKFRQALGGKVRLLISGGAPILPDVYSFFRSVINPNIIQGYGLTEVAVGGAVQEVGSKNPATIGPIAHSTDLKFVRVEGLDYDPKADPPAGEIYLRSDCVFSGYYKRDELTEEVFADGWFRTGDIGTISPEGHLMIIDRVKQLVKLSQGEYLSISSLTEVYSRTKGVANIFIHADSLHNYPVAVIIPTKEQIASWVAEGITDYCTSSAAKTKMLAQLMDAHKKYKLRGFERIPNILLDVEEFTIENGLLTPSMKPQLNTLRKKYEARLLELFD